VLPLRRLEAGKKRAEEDEAGTALVPEGSRGNVAEGVGADGGDAAHVVGH